MEDAAPRSEMFALADGFVHEYLDLSPVMTTFVGAAGHEDELDDYSPAAHERLGQLIARTRHALDAVPSGDEIDRIAGAALGERLEAEGAIVEAREPARTFGVIDSPVMNIRQVFELMPASTADDVAVITRRLRAVAGSLASWRATLAEAQARGDVVARRHVDGVVEQATAMAHQGWADFAASVRAVSGDASALDEAVRTAQAAYEETATWLRDVYAPRAAESVRVGRERYERWVRYYTGADLDLDETYAWGFEELQRLNERMWQVARAVAPGAERLDQVADVLDRDPQYRIEGTDELLRRLRAFTDAAVERVDGEHFAIDPRIRFCDVRLAPEGSAAAPYYISPSEDLTRPGTTWFPTLGETSFAWWRQVSTWYHESVPGHHLQLGTVVANRDRLSRFQRLLATSSGWAEGWALYAERLMDELGAFDSPGYELGYLQGQALRAARVVVDIGLHLGLPVPRDFGTLGEFGDIAGQVWQPDWAVATLVERAMESRAFAASEIDRYLAIPGQAISYKVGERVWLAARAEARARLGAQFSLPAFHAYSLALGPLGLDPFSAEMRRWRGGEAA